MAGEECDEAIECATGACFDGVCCNEPCAEPCRICSSEGLCTEIELGPDDQCPTYCMGGECQACPEEMVLVESVCMDRYEAPNSEGELPLVMYTFVEAEAWCSARSKRLCFDDEWTLGCAGPDGHVYPYGDEHQAGVCNDDETWLAYNQDLLNLWPSSASGPHVCSLSELFDAAAAVSSSGATAAEHVEALYQGEPSGSNTGCTNSFGAFDTCGNVEEWTRRRDGGEPSFHGNLKGRYWADLRTCQNNIITHGDYFRFYEIGFRCCLDAYLPRSERTR